MALTWVSRRANETKPTADPVTLSIVVPAYNEEGAVAATVKRIRAALSELPMQIRDHRCRRWVHGWHADRSGTVRRGRSVIGRQ